MKQITLTCCLTAMLLYACNNSGDDSKKKDEPSVAKTESSDKKNDETTTTESSDKKEEKKDVEPMQMPDSATMAKNWQAYMTPGDVHKMMAKWDGTWSDEVTMWMQPGAPELKSTSTSVNKMIMNGLYQQSSHSGKMMGMPFNGMSTTGYDIHKKEFVSTWIDNMGSGIMVLKGSWDDATKTITLKGRMTDPGTTGEVDVKETLKIIDDNTQEMEMFILMPDGKEFKTMNIKSTRKK